MTRAEFIKLRGLPVVGATVLVAIAIAASIAGATAASAPLTGAAGAQLTPAGVLFGIVPYLQAATILIGVLAAATEYQGSQYRTSLSAVPGRTSLLSAKALATLAVTALTSVLSVLAAYVAAAIALAARGVSLNVAADLLPVWGAALYLTGIGMLALAVAVLLRSLVPALVTMLALVFVASPMLVNVSEHARWLPDRAGRLLFTPGGDTVLNAASGGLVLLAWVGVAAAVAMFAFTRRDA